MIDKVCKIIENMVYEFNDLKRKELFNEHEIKMIANKRRQHEYNINSSSSLLLNFILYLEFEMNLENLREKRKEEKKIEYLDEIKKYKKLIKRNYTEFINLQGEIENNKNSKKCKKLKALINKNENEIKKYKNSILKMEKKLEILLQYSLSDNSLIKRIIKIFQVCLKKYFNNIQVWLQYLNFCYLKQKKEELENAILSSLKYHMKNELIWTIYLYYFYNIKKNIIHTRKLYVRAILFVPRSLYLNILYFNIEFDIFFKLLKNFKEEYKNCNNLDKFDDYCKKHKCEMDKNICESTNCNNNDNNNDNNNKNDNNNDNNNNNIKNDNINLNENFLKINSNENSNNEINIVKEEEKYGLDVIIFLVKKYLKTFQNDKSNLHIFIFLLLNVYLKIEKKKWVRNYILQYDDFKNIIFNSIEEHKMNQPCFYYYLFINECMKLSNFYFCEDSNFLHLKKNYYNDFETNYYKENIQKYFNLIELNNLLIELFNSFDKDIMIYFFCLFLTNLFDTFYEFNDISEVFKIDNNKNIPLQKKNEEIISTKTIINENFKDKIKEENNNLLEKKSDLQISSENKNILFFMKEPLLKSCEELEVFKFLKDEIFLCSNYKFHRINIEYIKQKDICIYNFLDKLNFTSYICLFENRHSLISKNNFIYDSEQVSKNKDILSSMLYFFLFNKNNLEKNYTERKESSINKDINFSEIKTNKKRKKMKEFLSDNIEESKRFKESENESTTADKKNIYENDNKNIYEHDSENKSESESDDESEEESDGESDDESDDESEKESDGESEEESDGESEEESDGESESESDDESEKESDDESEKDSNNESDDKNENKNECKFESKKEAKKKKKNGNDIENEDKKKVVNNLKKEKNSINKDKRNGNKELFHINNKINKEVKYHENNTDSEKKKILIKEIYIIDELLLLLDRGIDLFIKINILKCILNLIIFLNNKNITNYLKSIITHNYMKIKKNNLNNLLNKEINNLVYLYNRVYIDEFKM
ncbi:U3 small nucleolar RNA-associated protein 6, putative [Plasmodium gallinaceum]|uniref:U3 small nucleolar RNA-associated protein 6, putative n=1 Tax=Plasmodium gallinaceum TaxID=5849 RepID=A0A1J1H1P5_PLAGA|nr:U3 small nucleolar RNA-associated protein 6, putative [Plasmodium gallinaceum]CRG97459.1 U3 small nucleolar RNA-associated protein 6, putative [Plasmodium gallinaceum]